MYQDWPLFDSTLCIMFISVYKSTVDICSRTYCRFLEYWVEDMIVLPEYRGKCMSPVTAVSLLFLPLLIVAAIWWVVCSMHHMFLSTPKCVVISRVHNIYMERECPTLHMLCTNTLRKVMMQQPLTAQVLIKLKPYATLKFWQIRACNVLKMRVDWGVIISSSLMWKAVQTIGDDDEEFLKMGAARFWKNLKERMELGKYRKSALIHAGKTLRRRKVLTKAVKKQITKHIRELNPTNVSLL